MSASSTWKQEPEPLQRQREAQRLKLFGHSDSVAELQEILAWLGVSLEEQVDELPFHVIQSYDLGFLEDVLVIQGSTKGASSIPFPRFSLFYAMFLQ